MFSTSSSFIFLTGQGVHSTKTVMTTTGDDIQSTTGSEVDGNGGGGWPKWGFWQRGARGRLKGWLL